MKQSPKMPAEKRRMQLINSAARVFARKGYGPATTEEIARKAGLSKGALYFHFKNKQDIFFEVVRYFNEMYFDTIFEILEEEKDPLKAITRTIRIVLDINKKQKYVTPIFWQQTAKIPVVRKYLIERHKMLKKKIVTYIMTNGNLKKRDAENLYILLHTSLEGFLLLVSSNLGTVDMKNFVPPVVEMAKMFLENKE